LRKQHVVFDVDRETWKEFKAACAHFGISISGTLTKHVQNVANDYRLYSSGFLKGNQTVKGGKRK